MVELKLTMGVWWSGGRFESELKFGSSYCLATLDKLFIPDCLEHTILHFINDLTCFRNPVVIIIMIRIMIINHLITILGFGSNLCCLLAVTICYSATCIF